MKHLFVPYELAVKLKEKGFDESCLYYYIKNGEMCPEEFKLQGIKNGDFLWYKFNSFEKGMYYSFREKLEEHISAPLYQQVVDWLWNNYIIFISPVRESLGSDEWEFSYHIEWLPKDKWDLKRRGTSFEYINSYSESSGGTYMGAWPTINEALTKAIEEALKLITSQA